MNYAPALLSAANQAGICAAYYKLCAEHPLVPGSSAKKVPYKEILAAAKGQLSLSKLPGPGTVFRVEGLPQGVSLNFIIQSGGTIETDFSIQQAQRKDGGTFAILCNEAMKHSGLAAPNPAYPRPTCSSSDAMVAAFKRFHELLLALAQAGKHAG